MGAFSFLAFLPTIATAQGITEPLPAIPQTSLPKATESPSMTTSMLSSARNSTTSSTSTPTPSPSGDDFDPNQNFGPGGYTVPSNDATPKHTHSDVINYYFLFLAIFCALIAVFLWWVHKRRKQRKEALRLSGQNALARDMDGWINTRRWFHGTWRHNQATVFVRREEGLNERGEAPPPYRPMSEETGSVAVAPAREPAIPLRTLSRDENGSTRPPEYRESLNRIDTAPEPHTENMHADTADIQPGSSARDLLRDRNPP